MDSLLKVFISFLTLIWFLLKMTKGDFIVEDDYEIIQVSTENVGQEKRLRFSAFRQSYDLPLEKAQIKFADDFQFVELNAKKKRKRNISKNMLQSHISRGQFYSIKRGLGTVHVEEVDNRTRVEGIIDEKFRISPDTKGHGHRAWPLNLQAEHSHSFLNDYELPKIDRSKLHARITNWMPYEMEVAYVEVLVVLDHVNTRALNLDRDNVYSYLGIFWNSVQKLYSHLKSPRVQFVIKGAIMNKQPRNEPYIQENMADQKEFNGIRGLIDFKAWLAKNENCLPPFDLAVLQTGMDMVQWIEGKKSNSLLGRAYLSTLCDFPINSGISEDMAPLYTGVLTMAHEIGHILGLYHDGENTSKSCLVKDGHLMSTHLGGAVTAHRFSRCSEENLRLSLRHFDCIWNEPEEKIKLVNRFPGEGWSLNDVCEHWFGNGIIYSKIENPCNYLWCRFQDKTVTSRGPSPEGVYCDAQNSKICIKGKCVEKNGNRTKRIRKFMKHSKP